MGPTGATCIAGLIEAIRHNGIDLVYCARAADGGAVDVLPQRAVRLCKNRSGVEPQVVAAVRAGDVIMSRRPQARGGTHRQAAGAAPFLRHTPELWRVQG